MKTHSLRPLFISGYVEKRKEPGGIIVRERTSQIAANALCERIIKGLDEHYSDPTLLLGDRFINGKKGSSVFQKREKWGHSGSSEDLHIRYAKAGELLTYASKLLSLGFEAIRYSKARSVNGVILYSMHLPYLLAAMIIKKIYKKPIVMIVPDLPKYMDMDISKKPLKRGMKLLESFIFAFALRRVDGFVLLTEHMKEALKFGDKPFDVMEGIVPDMPKGDSTRKAAGKVVAYTGTLDLAYGISDLIEAFTLIDGNDYELWICGNGPASEYVKESANRDGRIKFFGAIPREKVLELQRKATLLVNPRNGKESFTKYSFPSKTLEYMASGTPVLMRRLEGIPKIYDEYIFYDKDGSVLSLSGMIRHCCDLPKDELLKSGQRARDFVNKEKNYSSQVGKIIRVLETAIADTNDRH